MFIFTGLSPKQVKGGEGTAGSESAGEGGPSSFGFVCILPQDASASLFKGRA